MNKNIHIIISVIIFYCFLALPIAGQTQQIIKDTTRMESDSSLILKRFAHNFDKKSGFSKIDTKGTMVSPTGNVIGRVFYNSTYVDKISNYSYKVTYIGEVIDFSGKLIGYVHPKFYDNPKGLVFEINGNN